jgi:hypothetical protein
LGLKPKKNSIISLYERRRREETQLSKSPDFNRELPPGLIHLML